MSGFTRAQVEALLRPINPKRVLSDQRGMAHLSQQDVRAHLTRVFGFGGWSTEILNLDLVHADRNTKFKDGKEIPSGWAVTYRCTLRLTIKDPSGQTVTSFEEVGSGTSPNLPALGDAHDFAMKVAVSIALKRAATNLGDAFGLSLYNKGQIAPLVIDTLVKPEGSSTTEDVQDNVPQQVSMGHDDAGSATDNSPSAALPESNSDQVSGRAASGPAATDVPADLSQPPSAPSTEDVVASLRDRAIEATTLNKREGLKTMARLQAEAAKGKLMLAPTTRPDGSATTVNVLLDEAMRKLNATSEAVA